MLTVALKEWAVVCDLLAEGRCKVLLRKGGIHEHRGPGRFELEHGRFAFYPAWEHQWPEGVKPELSGRVEVFDVEPATAALKAVATVDETMVFRVPSRDAFDGLDDLHPWSKEQVDVRFNYKPDRPLYLLCPRVYRLRSAKAVPNRDAYKGCKSWVPMDAGDAVDDAAATPVLPDDEFTAVLQRVAAALR